MIEIGVRPRTSIEKWSINIGRSALNNAQFHLNKVFRNKDFQEELRDYLSDKLITALNRLNAISPKIPVYTGEYVASYIAEFYSGDIVKFISSLRPAGVMALHDRYAPFETRYERVSRALTYTQSAFKYIPVISTGGGLNPNMAYISSFVIYGGKKHPFYTSKIEFEGWGTTPPYDIRAWDWLFEELSDIVLEGVEKIVEKYL